MPDEIGPSFRLFSTLDEAAKQLSEYTGVPHTVRGLKRRVYEDRTMKASKIGERAVIHRGELIRYVEQCEREAAALVAPK